ncbi:MAG: SpoIIE family protein phosphatase [Verrucomicrobia bacterium]|nr:SpoIIE family protein phosphatase [Verrucomicrobiota bacterium]
MIDSPVITLTPQLRASIACNLAHVRPVAQKLREFLGDQGVPEEDLMSCELAFVEACNNAVLYAPQKAESLPIDVSARCSDGQIEIAIHDHTTGFKLPAIVALPRNENESGRGLFIIRSIMDEITYTPDACGNTMVMIKRRSDSLTTQAHFSREKTEDYSRKLAESEQVISEMAEELSSCYETLSTIFRCGAELGKTNNVITFATSLCNDLLQITESDWYVLRIISEERTRLIPFATSVPGAKLEPLFVPSPGKATTVEMQAAATRRDVWFNTEQPVSQSDPLHQFGSESIGLVHPILFADNLTGTLTVGKSAGRSRFTAAQANIVHTFADFLAIQFVNTQLQEEQLKHKLVSRELEIAKSIQRALLPKTLPQPCGFGLAGYCEFAQTVGGDFYDVVPVSDNSLLLIIADVMGKGIPAAMFAAILRSVLRAAPELNQQPAALLQRVNRLLYEELSEVEMFITAQLAFLDFEKRELIVASAGHCPILLGSPTSQLKAISPDGIPLGILPDANYETHIEQLPRDARLLLYTDGLTDARNISGSFFSEERLLIWFKSVSTEDKTAEELKLSLADAVHQFQGEAAPFDDQTFLILAEQNSARRRNVPENFSR